MWLGSVPKRRDPDKNNQTKTNNKPWVSVFAFYKICQNVTNKQTHYQIQIPIPYHTDRLENKRTKCKIYHF